MGIVGISRATKSTHFPPEFTKLPLLRPPNMQAKDELKNLWFVSEDWKTPAINGKQACVRGPVKLPDGSLYGFFTDGISVPQLGWSIFNLHPFSMPELCAALGHDIVYSAELASRKTCDEWMVEWLKMVDVSKKRRELIHGILKAFGGFVWRRHTPESIAEARTMCQLVDAGTEPEWN